MAGFDTSAQGIDAPFDQAGAPGVLRRLAVMTYEAVLLFGLVFVVGFAVVALPGWTYPLTPPQRWVLQGALFIAVGAYFVHCWVRSGQTLAMKSWRLRLVDRDGKPPTARRALLRYLLSWSLFVPGLLAIAFTGIDPLWNLFALAASVLLMLLPARLDPRRQLLHDRLLGTRVIQD